VHKAERALIDEYRRCVGVVLAQLSPSNHPRAVALAALPDCIRGYEGVKMHNIETYHEELFRACPETLFGVDWQIDSAVGAINHRREIEEANHDEMADQASTDSGFERRFNDPPPRFQFFIE
jgi:hypothetical protein